MDDYKSNSHKSKTEAANNVPVEKKEVQKVANGKVRKKSNLSKAAENFVNEDVANVKDYVVGDVLIPALKKAISDVVTNGIDMLLYGETRSHDRKSSSISYNKYSERDRDRRRDDRYRGGSSRGYSLDDIVLETRSEAEDVLSSLDGLIDTYGVASVADLYDLIGVSCDYTDNKYGWSSLRSAEAVRVRDGYKLRLPKAMPID